MHSYDPSTLEHIKAELAFLWQVQERQGLHGEMRLYTQDYGQFWQPDQINVEVWFGPKDLQEIIKKIDLYYRQGGSNASPLLLDPIVYEREADKPIKPLGSGLIWATVLYDDPDEITEAKARLESLGVFCAIIETAEGTAGLKLLGFLNGIQPKSGNAVDGCEALMALAHSQADVQGFDRFGYTYLLSGLHYPTSNGNKYESTLCALPNIDALQSMLLPLQKIQEAAICWNAYNQNQEMLARYGIDVKNLERNLRNEETRRAEVDVIKRELAWVWQLHHRHEALRFPQARMRIYTAETQDVWRAKQPGFEFWFGEHEIDEAAEHIRQYYNAGLLPNSPLLLDPILYRQVANNYYEPVGTGFSWATILVLGKDHWNNNKTERLKDIGALIAPIHRGNEVSGAKVIVPLESPALVEEGQPPPGAHELYQLANCTSDDYWPYYLISGLEYLSSHGSFSQRQFSDLLKDQPLEARPVAFQHILDAAICWNAYDRHHTLWQRFGVDVANLSANMRYFNLCARDFSLLDATHSLKEAKDMEKFELMVNGWVPRAAVTLLAAVGGVGKSSVAHALCVKAAIDYSSEEKPPLWLGSPLNLEYCSGLCIYFSGEDGPGIINARAELFDPEQRAKRMMFFRTDFGLNKHGEASRLSDFMLEKLHRLPDVSIVVIDPARKYLTGDEDDSDVVSHFFEGIEEFAISKKCAMVVVHHLSKGAKPKNVPEVLDSLRGSQVFIDRPRVVIGMCREGPYTIAGLAKNNIPPTLGMVQGERVFARDPNSLELLWLPGSEGVRNVFTPEEIAKLKSQKD